MTPADELALWAQLGHLADRYGETGIARANWLRAAHASREIARLKELDTIPGQATLDVLECLVRSGDSAAACAEGDIIGKRLGKDAALRERFEALMARAREINKPVSVVLPPGAR